MKVNLAFSKVLNLGVKFPSGPQFNLAPLTLLTATATKGAVVDLSMVMCPSSPWVQPVFLRNIGLGT